MEGSKNKNIFEILSEKDVFLHHPYNSFDPVIRLLNEAAEDPNVLSIKITLYRTAKNSRVIDALLKAAENGKHVSVLFEVKARFDEENNLKNGYQLEKAGCYVIYGIGSLKTHTKLLLIVRREGKKVVSKCSIINSVIPFKNSSSSPFTGGQSWCVEKGMKMCNDYNSYLVEY